MQRSELEADREENSFAGEDLGSLVTTMMVGLGDFGGLFQPRCFCDSVKILFLS